MMQNSQSDDRITITQAILVEDNGVQSTDIDREIS